MHGVLGRRRDLGGARLRWILERLAVGGVTHAGTRLVDLAAHHCDARLFRRRVRLGHTPDIIGEILAVIALAALADLLARDDERRGMDIAAFAHRPFHHRLVERHGPGIGAPLDHEAEAVLVLGQPVLHVDRQIVRAVVWHVLRPGSGSETDIDEFTAQPERQDRPIGRGQHATLDLGHVVQDFAVLGWAAR